MRGRNRSLAVVCALALIALSCGGGPDGAPPGVLRVGWAGSPDTMNPGTAVLSEAYTVFELVYDAMYSLRLDGTFAPELAEACTRSADGRTYTFTIRAGFAFHDGHPLTAGDVAFSYNLYKSHPDFPYLNAYTRQFESVHAPDDRTVVLRLKGPIPNVESQLVFLYVLPEHLWAAHAEGRAAAEFENAAAVGSGPFRLVECRQNEFVRLAANRTHPLTPPQIDGVVFQTFANQDALVQAIRTGQVDMITEMPNPAVASLRREPDIRVVTGIPLSPNVTDIVINQLAPEHCPKGAKCSGHPALRDRNVRQALAHATDKATLIDVVLLGLGAPGLTLIPDGLGEWYNRDLVDYAFDVDRANQILDRGGYRDRDGDGVREMPDGTRSLVFRMDRPSDSTVAPRLSELLAAMWSRIGVRAEIRSLDPDALSAECCPAFDHDLLLWGWDSDPDPSLLLSAMTSDQIPTGNSEAGYSNPTYDALFLRQATELDPQKRRQIVWEMQRIVHEDAVYIIPFYARAVQAFRTDRFSGWAADAPKVALESPVSLTSVRPSGTACLPMPGQGLLTDRGAP